MSYASYTAEEVATRGEAWYEQHIRAQVETVHQGKFVVVDIETGDYPEGTTVGDVADTLKLPRSELGIMMINNRHVKLDRQLVDGDTLALFPLLGGG